MGMSLQLSSLLHTAINEIGLCLALRMHMCIILYSGPDLVDLTVAV